MNLNIAICDVSVYGPELAYWTLSRYFTIYFDGEHAVFEEDVEEYVNIVPL